VASTISNARAFLKIQEQFGSFDAYLWRFVEGRPIQNAWRSIKEVPASTAGVRCPEPRPEKTAASALWAAPSAMP
jgi:3-methyladenine DNA glycosylase Tag